MVIRALVTEMIVVVVIVVVVAVVVLLYLKVTNTTYIMAINNVL